MADINFPYQSWKDEYKTGVPSLDTHHKQLFKMLDQMFAHQKTPSDDFDLLSLLHELERFMSVHFKEEEELIKDIPEDRFKIHQDEHSMFSSKMDEFYTAYKYKNPMLETQVRNFLCKWIIKHIIVIDQDDIETAREIGRK